jgi:hypothetical protein
VLRGDFAGRLGLVVAIEKKEALCRDPFANQTDNENATLDDWTWSVRLDNCVLTDRAERLDAVRIRKGLSKDQRLELLLLRGKA